jgi:hypothetical protein
MRISRTSPRGWALVAVVVTLAAVSGPRAAAQASPFAGTWVLNLAKSKFSPGPLPKNQTAVYEVTGDKFKLTATGTDAAGGAINTQYTASIDGKDYPVTGNADYDAVSMKRVNANKISFTRKKGGKVVQTGTNEVSTDGKTRTVTVDGTNASGQKIHNVSVYDKK